MNTSHISPTDATEIMDAEATGQVHYGLVVFICVLIVITMVTFLSFACTRLHLQRGDWPSQVATATDHDHDHADPDSLTIDVGLDEATLRSFPKLLYSHAKVHQGEPTASSCSICLGNYKEKDTLRLLPDCGHLFHLKCVDPWLRLHPTCPICRHSPLPTPLTTPLAEVAPLATRRD